MATIDSFEAELQGFLSSYSDRIHGEIKVATAEAAKECVKAIQSNIDGQIDGTGAYRRSWKSKKTSESRSATIYTVYSEKYYRLTHLLEYGHEIWIRPGHAKFKKGKMKPAGRRTAPRAHIRPAAEAMERNYMTKIEEILRG